MRNALFFFVFFLEKEMWAALKKDDPRDIYYMKNDVCVYMSICGHPEQ